MLNREAIEKMRESLQGGGVQTVSAPQLFPTPPELATRIVKLADIRPRHRVLEPSAGTGNILRAIGDKPDKVAVEINPQVVTMLMRCGVSGLRIHQADFLECNASDIGTFDRVVMNPPFSGGADIRHIEHARTLLNPGGRLVALCANGPRQQGRLKPGALEWIDLEPGAFASSGTDVNAAICIYEARP